MLNLNADKLEQTAAEALSLAAASRRWQAALVRGLQILRDSPYWHMTEDGALLILSPDSAELYEVAEGRCDLIDGERRAACKAFAQGQPCKHRAARRLLIRYHKFNGGIGGDFCTR